MQYLNSSMKIDQLVSYLNERKINLAPAFQRGHVWKLTARRKLVRNIVLKKPIPAIFLYKEATGSRYSYNILDGKQRLESLILFIAATRNDLKIDSWKRYFYEPQHKAHASFHVDLAPGDRKRFVQLSDKQVRDFREYSIPTIEISLDDDTALDEIITLFVDINQQGEPVKRFSIVKALNRGDPLLKSVFALVAQEQHRGGDVLYKPKQTPYTSVLKRLQVVATVEESNAKVDKMWEKLVEFAIFAMTREHRKSTVILNQFIAPGKDLPYRRKLTQEEMKLLRSVFSFLRTRLAALGATRLFTDQTHSYTMITSIMRSDLIAKFGADTLAEKLDRFARLLAQPKHSNNIVASMMKNYLEVSERQTTDVSRRIERDRLFVHIVTQL